MVAPKFTTGRMLQDYQQRYYNPQFERSVSMKSENFKWARELSEWKNKVASVWNSIEVLQKDSSNGIKDMIKVGQEYPFKVEIDLKGLSCSEVGLELVVIENGTNDAPKIVETFEFEVEKCENSIACFKLNFHPVHPGSFNYGIRLYPKKEGLPHRQDFTFIKWL